MTSALSSLGNVAAGGLVAGSLLAATGVYAAELGCAVPCVDPVHRAVTEVLTWLESNGYADVGTSVPAVLLVDRTVLERLKYGAPAVGSGSDLIAIYDDREATILLLDTWTGHGAENESVLVHELMHHVQKTRHEKFACAAEREIEAYGAQSEWLKSQGTSLEQAFGIDGFTLLVRTTCLN